MTLTVPNGHGSRKLKREALDEIVLRVIDALRQVKPSFSIPFCVFNGGSDAWLDIGDFVILLHCKSATLNLSTHIICALIFCSYVLIICRRLF